MKLKRKFNKEDHKRIYHFPSLQTTSPQSSILSSTTSVHYAAHLTMSCIHKIFQTHTFGLSSLKYVSMEDTPPYDQHLNVIPLAAFLIKPY